MDTLTPIARQIAVRLKARKETIAVAESSAGGLISAALLSIEGASRYYISGAVIYTHHARTTLTSIEDQEMARYRSSSEPYASLLSQRTRERANADWGLAESGASGPSGNRYGDAPGHTCLAISYAKNVKLDCTMTLETARSERTENMRAFAKAALQLLLNALEQAEDHERSAVG